MSASAAGRVHAASLNMPTGLRYEFYLLGPDDWTAVVRFYESLDVYSIYYRFLGLYRDFEAHAKRLFSGRCNYAFGAFVGDEETPVGLGEGFSDCTSAELAFAVRPEHRGRGLATVLASLLVLEAARRGIRTMEAYMHAENVPAVRIGERLGLNLVIEEGGVYHGKAEVARIKGLALKAIEDKGAMLAPTYTL